MFRVAIAQDAPVFLDPAATTQRILHHIDEAARQEVSLLAFGETFLPGYPFWLAHTNGAAFDDPDQKEAYRHYLEGAVRADGPELAAVEARVRERGVAVVLGAVERAFGPHSGSVYCSIFAIDPESGTHPAHRKLVPTYEERLVWSPGDGHGLQVRTLAGQAVSMLNCWENWMPQARHALYAQGPAIHVAVWPGAARLTRDITRFVALEGRMFVISASGLLSRADVGPEFPLADELPDREWFYDGGSAIAAPDGRFVVAPTIHERGLIVADLDLDEVARERHNFDPVGHYARPDVFGVEVDRRRRAAARFVDHN